MYDIICDIWKNPGSAFSAMPVWVWNKIPQIDELVSEINDFHKKGIDGFVIMPGKELGDWYLSEEYFSVLKSVLEAAKKRFMITVIADARDHSASPVTEYLTSEKRLSARKLYAKSADVETALDEEILFRIYVKLENELLIDVAIDAREGYEAYDLVMGYADSNKADIFNPVYAESLVNGVYNQYADQLGEYFGNTLIGFLNRGDAYNPGGYIPWTYYLAEEFFEAGGDFMSLASLFFMPKSKKIRREAEFTLAEVLRKRFADAYTKPLTDWCGEHKIGFFGYTDDIGNTDSLSIAHFPGQYLGGQMGFQPLTAKESAAVKLASDCARHRGLSRSFALTFDKSGREDNPWNFTSNEMMRNLNYVFARGGSMIMPCNFYYSPEDAASDSENTPDVGQGNIWWKDYRKIAGYIKRMSWLCSTGTNNPCAAVLCSPDYVPTVPVKPLIEGGYTFNYLTLEDFMERAHIHDGEIHIDRYCYKLVLIDGRLRLNADIVLKLGKFITGGGVMFRGSDFIGAVKKNVKPTSYFEGEGGGNLRFAEYTKSGCPFFMLMNEGHTEISGRFITDKGFAAAEFDPFGGKTIPVGCEMVEGGFAYSITVPPHSVKIIGMNPTALPLLEKPEVTELSEIVSLTDGRMTFDYKKADDKLVKLSFTDIREIADVTVNGKEAGRLIFKPYELDITELVQDGENVVGVTLTESLANKYGTAVPGKFSGCTVRIYKKK